jgi:hypothetical protein
MLTAYAPYSKLSIVTLTLGMIAAFAIPAWGQEAPAVHAGAAQVTGLPDDWSHRHVVFSNPGTEQEAISAGRHEHWQKVVNEPRYVVQQLKKSLPIQGPAAVDAAYRAKWFSEAHGRNGAEGDKDEDDRSDSGNGERSHHRNDHGKDRHNPTSTIKGDWSMALGGPGLAAGEYPAKYVFSGSVANCSDYVVYPTGAAGGAAQATIVAFNNIYVGASGGCAVTLPTVYWAYNTGTGGTARLSPVTSYDGTQVAYIQISTTNVASLVLLHMASSGGTVTGAPGPAAITAVTNAQYRTCNGGSPPCYTTIALNGNPNDTDSAPFYNYANDNLYVGDDAGKVHLFTGVFQGTPAETVGGGWPVTASTTPFPALTSPVYDSGASNRIFVTDAAGYLHTFTLAAPGTITTSGQLETNTSHVFESPIVDSTTEQVYTFIGYSGDTGHTSHPSYINRFPAGTALSGAGAGAGSGFGTGVWYSNGGATNPATSNMRAGAFDNTYLTGPGTTGNVYSCENGVLYQIPVASITLATPVVNVYSTPVSAVGIAATCSPVTEFLGVKVSTTLSATMTNVQATVSVASNAGMAVGDYVQVESEIMLIGAPFANPLNVTRGQLGTTAAAHTTTGVAVQDIRDWLFMSVASNAKAPCSPTGGACVYNYNVINSALTAGNPTAGLSEPGGTSGFVIDNQSTTQTGAQQIYFSTLTGHTAVQASQSGLN